MGGGGLVGGFGVGSIGEIDLAGGGVVGGTVSLYAGGGGEEGEPFSSCSAAASACFVSATGACAGVFVRDKRLLFEARVRERLLDSAETELERRLGSLLKGDWGEEVDGPLGEVEGDRAWLAAGGGDETEVGVLLLLLDTGDQVSG